MNFLQTKLRNRLSIKTMDMLSFIYINARSLRRARNIDDGEAKLLEELMGDILLNIEDDMIQIELDNRDQDQDEDEDIIMGN